MSEWVERVPGAPNEFAYDLAEAERVINAMDKLRQQAIVTGIPEIVTIVDSTFRLLVTTYYSILRYEMEKLPPTGE